MAAKKAGATPQKKLGYKTAVRMRLYDEIEAAAMADDFEGLFDIASSAKRADFIKMLDRLEEDGHSSMAFARNILRDRRLTRAQEQAIMILSAYCLGSMVRVENALPYTFKALKVDRSSVEYDDVEGYNVTGDTVAMNTANIDQAATIAKLQFLMNHVIETVAANSVSTKRDCYYMLKNQFQKYPWMDLNGQGESDRLIDTLERIIRMQRENLNIIADPRGLIYGDITLIDEEGKEFSCRDREQ
ncbi:MAG TPA: DNA topoisomerase IV subunit A, partial [Methanocella sp.]|nr:DNA topoisomerase IV subunit A [Methanocella sp.]